MVKLVQTRIDLGDAVKLERLAAKDQRSVASLLRILITNYIKQQEGES